MNSPAQMKEVSFSHAFNRFSGLEVDPIHLTLELAVEQFDYRISTRFCHHLLIYSHLAMREIRVLFH